MVLLLLGLFCTSFYWRKLLLNIIIEFIKYQGWFLFQAIFLFSVIKYEKLVYADTYEYPWYGELIGWILASSSVLCIPFYAIYFLLCKTDKTLTLKEVLTLNILLLNYFYLENSCSVS